MGSEGVDESGFRDWGGFFLKDKINLNKNRVVNIPRRGIEMYFFKR